MRTLIAMALLVSASACGKKEESIDAEACEHLKAGPAVPVTAAMGTVGAPAIAADHRRYDITLVGSPGDKGGSVSFAAGVSGDFAFFMSADVHARFADMGGMTISPESRTTNSPACTEIKTKYIVPLKVGSATLSFAYGPDEKVSVLAFNEPPSGGSNSGATVGTAAVAAPSRLTAHLMSPRLLPR